MDQVVSFNDIDWISDEDDLSLHPQIQTYGKHLGGRMDQEIDPAFTNSFQASKGSKDGSLCQSFSDAMPPDGQVPHHKACASFCSCCSIDEDLLAYIFSPNNHMDGTCFSESLTELGNNHVNACNQLTTWQVLEPFSQNEPQNSVVIPDATQALQQKSHLGTGEEKVTNPNLQAIKTTDLHQPIVEVLFDDRSYSLASSSALQPPKCPPKCSSPDSLRAGGADALNFACFLRPAFLTKAKSMLQPTTEVPISIADSEGPTLSSVFPCGMLDALRRQVQNELPPSQSTGCADPSAIATRSTESGSLNCDVNQGLVGVTSSIALPDKISHCSTPQVVEAMEPSSMTSLGDSPDAAENNRKLEGKGKIVGIKDPIDSKRMLDHELPRPAQGRLKRSRAAEVHNLSERRRRDRINEKMRALQKLIPNSNKTDKASMLDEAIEYLKMLQSQLQYVMQMISVRSRMIIPLILPIGQEQLQVPQMTPITNLRMVPGLGTGVEMQLGPNMMGLANNVSGWHLSPLPFSGFPNARGLPSATISDSRHPYISPEILNQQNAMVSQQPLQPVNVDLFQAYVLGQQQLHQSQSQHLHGHAQQHPSGPFPMKNLSRSS